MTSGGRREHVCSRCKSAPGQVWNSARSSRTDEFSFTGDRKIIIAISNPSNNVALIPAQSTHAQLSRTGESHTQLIVRLVTACGQACGTPAARRRHGPFSAGIRVQPRSGGRAWRRARARALVQPCAPRYSPAGGGKPKGKNKAENPGRPPSALRTRHGAARPRPTRPDPDRPPPPVGN